MENLVGKYLIWSEDLLKEIHEDYGEPYYERHKGYILKITKQSNSRVFCVFDRGSEFVQQDQEYRWVKIEEIGDLFKLISEEEYNIIDVLT